jgi:hypothetical protein
MPDPLIEECKGYLDAYDQALKDRRAGLVQDVVVYEAEQMLLGSLLHWKAHRTPS